MWNCKSKPADTVDKDRRIQELEQELTRRTNDVTNLQSRLKDIENSCRSASFEFDFKAVKVFSVERNIKDNLPCTIIGYLLPEPAVFTEDNVTTKEVVREWYLYCDEKQHEALIKAFKESRK